MFANSLRSSEITSTFPFGFDFKMSFFASSFFLLSLAAMMTCAPAFAKTLAVSFPIPELDPVTLLLMKDIVTLQLCWKDLFLQ